MNPTYRITMPWLKWDSSSDVQSTNPLSNNTRTNSVETRLYGAVTQTFLNTSQQTANGIFEYVTAGGITDTSQLYPGKPKIAANIKVNPSKKYNPLTYGKKFSPSDLPNLFWWFAGEDLFNEFKTVGDPIDRWVNRVRTQNDFVQGGATSIRPTISISWNGFPCLLFDGVDDFMTCAFNTSANQDYTWYFFIRLPDFPAGIIRYFLDNGAATNTPAFRSNANNATYPTGFSAFPTGLEIYIPKSPNAPPFLYFYSHKNAGGLIDAFGAYPYTAVQYSTPQTTNIVGNATMRMGSQSTGANFFKGEVYEIVVFQQTHSIGYEVELMKYYFAQKYKIDAFWI